MIDFKKKSAYGYDDLVNIIHILRSPGGCPWDMEQTHLSIRRNFLEETYEALEAIDTDNPVLMCEELGDVLMQILFHGDMEQDAGRFTLEDIYDGVCQKLILRHPHIFAHTSVADSAEVLANWEDIKRIEKGQKTHTQALEAVAKTLPSTWRAEKLQKKAAKAGFVWDTPMDALNKLTEEIEELKLAVSTQGNIEEELGDVLFATVNTAFMLHKDPEDMLSASCDKFTAHFSAMEAKSLGDNRPLQECSKEELLALWMDTKSATSSV